MVRQAFPVLLSALIGLQGPAAAAVMGVSATGAPGSARAFLPEAVRAPLSAYLNSPIAGSAQLIPALEALRRYSIPAPDASVADAALLAALGAKVQALRQRGLSDDAGLPEARAVHYELMLLSRELSPWLPQETRRFLEETRAEAAQVLERRFLDSLGAAARALALTRSPLELDAVDDAGRMSRTKVQAVLQPRSIEDISAALDEARRRGLKVSLSGARHSQGGQIVSAGSLHLNMDRFKAASLDPEKNLLTVQTGALWGDLQALLDAHGKSLDVTQVPNYFSVGGTLSVNAHGHNPDSGPAASTVEALRIMLADGRILRASREVNTELFRLALGGYGLVGIILEAVLRVRDNALYTFDFHRLPMKDFASFHAKELAGDPATRYSHNLISIAPGSFLKEVVVTRYRQAADPARLPPPLREGWRDRMERTVSDALNGLNRGPGWTKSLSWWLFSRILWRFAQKEVTRNRAMNEPFTHFSNGSARQTQILQEYFVPRERLNEFMDKARAVLAEKPLSLVMVAIRAVKADPDSFLAYAPRDAFGVVFISNHIVSGAAFERLDESTRGLIGAALSSGAKFYLPYRRVYSRETLDKAYPQMERFFEIKRTYDPQERFSNKLYETYAHPDPRDANFEYRAAWDKSQGPLSQEQMKALQGYKVLFLKGLLADAYLKFGQYFDASIKELQDSGIDAELVDTNAEDSPEANLPAVAAAIEGSDKPVLLVTHSMGGLVSLHALLERPELRRKVKGWAALQAPFFGSPVADWILRRPHFRWKLRKLLELFGGDEAALRALATAERRAYMSRNASAIAKLTEDVPVVSLATWKERRSWWRPDTLLKLTRDWMLKTLGLRGDGLVDVESAVLPGSDFAVVEGIDHAVPVMPSPVLSFDRARFTRAFLSMLLTRVR